MADSIRIDKWLWAVRAFKTRSIATEACKSGRVTINDQTLKPSREVRIGDEIKIVLNPHFTRSLRVKEILKNRVGAKLVPDFAEDITPQEEHDRLKKYLELNYEKRDRGVGRPTKKERRDIDRLKDSDFFDYDWGDEEE